jgi:ABC-2 type transport system permease protein
MNEKSLWIERVKNYWLQASRYIQYMLNSLIYTVIITLVIAAYYYAAWLRTLDASYPYLFVISIVVAIALSFGKVRTFLQEPDQVFLLPYEHKLSSYFRNSIIYSVIFQLIYVGVVMLILFPLYEKYEYATKENYIALVIIVLLIKSWNLLLKWQVSRMKEKNFHTADFIVRFTVNFLFVYFLLANASILVIGLITIIVLAMHFTYNRTFVKNHRLQWEYLIKVEQSSIESFYRLANLFTDVPHLKSKVKPRTMITQLITLVSRKNNAPFSYLYWRSFIRAGDYLGIYFRLLVIGSLLITFIPNDYMKIAVFFLFIYLSAFQLVSLWKHFDIKLWVNLYPIPMKKRAQEFQKVYQVLLVIKSIVLLVVMSLSMSNYIYLLTVFLLSIGFIWFYSKVILRKKSMQ